MTYSASSADSVLRSGRGTLVGLYCFIPLAYLDAHAEPVGQGTDNGAVRRYA